jgi:hypothetical protein
MESASPELPENGEGPLSEEAAGSSAQALAEAEEAMEGGPGLSIQRLKELMERLTQSWSQNETPVQLYSEVYFEWTKMFKHLGPAISIAFKGMPN